MFFNRQNAPGNQPPASGEPDGQNPPVPDDANAGGDNQEPAGTPLPEPIILKNRGRTREVTTAEEATALAQKGWRFEQGMAELNEKQAALAKDAEFTALGRLVASRPDLMGAITGKGAKPDDSDPNAPDDPIEKLARQVDELKRENESLRQTTTLTKAQVEARDAIMSYAQENPDLGPADFQQMSEIIKESGVQGPFDVLMDMAAAQVRLQKQKGGNRATDAAQRRTTMAHARATSLPAGGRQPTAMRKDIRKISDPDEREAYIAEIVRNPGAFLPQGWDE